LRFRFRPGDEERWRPIGDPQDALVLSDEFVETRNREDPVPSFGFTGAHVGLVAYDLTETVSPPAFSRFEYRGRETPVEEMTGENTGETQEEPSL
jgi:hypothetical protein